MRTVQFAKADISLFEESTLRKHNEAMACLDWEEIAQRGTLAFRSLMKAEKEYGDLLGRGELEYSLGEDARLYIFFLVWMGIAKGVHDQIIQFEKSGYAVDGADAFRKCCNEGGMIAAASVVFFEAHGAAMDELRESATDLFEKIVHLDNDWLPEPSERIPTLLQAIRKRNVEYRELDEAEALAMSDLKQFPGTILGELISRRYQLYPTITKGSWERG